MWKSELPLWELESWWIPNSLENDYRGQNQLDRVPYIIGKLLECRCLKWAHMTHLDTYKTFERNVPTLDNIDLRGFHNLQVCALLF